MSNHPSDCPSVHFALLTYVTLLCHKENRIDFDLINMSDTPIHHIGMCFIHIPHLPHGSVNELGVYSSSILKYV